MTLHQVMSVKQKLRLNFKDRLVQHLRKGTLYDFQTFLDEPVEDVIDLIGELIHARVTLQSAKGPVNIGLNPKSTIADWASVTMFSILTNSYKIALPANMISSVGYEMACFMFFALADSMMINYVYTANRSNAKSRIKFAKVRMPTITELKGCGSTFVKDLADGVLTLIDEDNRSENALKIPIASMTLPLIATPTENGETDITVITREDLEEPGVKLYLQMYAPVKYVKTFVKGLADYLTKVNSPVLIKHIKSDFSTRSIITTLKDDVMLEVWNNKNRVETAKEKVTLDIGRGYVHIPDLDLPENDESQTRALNLLRVVDFRKYTGALKKLSKVASINYRDARFVLQLCVLQNSKNKHISNKIYKILCKEGIIQDGVDMCIDDTDEYKFNKLIDIFKNPETNLNEFDKRCYGALVKIVGEENAQTALTELQPVRSISERDVTKDFAMSDNQIGFLTSILFENALELTYINKSKFKETIKITKNKDIVSKVYGAGWKTIGRNYTLREKRKDMESAVEFLQSINALNLIKAVANEWGITVKEEGTIGEIRDFVINALNEMIGDIAKREEKYKKPINDNTILAYSLDVNKALMQIDADSFNLHRRVSVPNVVSVKIIELG